MGRLYYSEDSKAYSGIYTSKWKLYRSNGDHEKFHNCTHLPTNHHSVCLPLLSACKNLSTAELHKLNWQGKQGFWPWFLLTLGVVRQGEQADAGGSGPRSKHSDPAGVSSEGCDVLLHPAQSLDLIQQAVVPFCRLVTCAKKSYRQTEREMLLLHMVEHIVLKTYMKLKLKFSVE